MTKTKVGIIGCGTIGSALAKAILTEFKDFAVLSFLCDHHLEKAKKLEAVLHKKPPIVDLETLVRKSDLVIEAASLHVVAEVMKYIQKYRKEILVMSVGGLLDSRVFNDLKKKKIKVWIPSGAVAGIDGVLAGAESKIRSVKLVTRKPPTGLKDAPHFQNKPFPNLKGNKEYCVFKGSAEQAVRSFPQNINVGAILSLAGVGAKKTQVEIWTSKKYRSNQHEVSVEGEFGRLNAITQNVPSKENPKTSALAIYSAKATLRRIFSSVKVGT
jgi:aspartate dehydrogenase